jgi:hypothetical protein
VHELHPFSTSSPLPSPASPVVAGKLHEALRGEDGTRPIIWLAGDSSLDNKHWLLSEPRVAAAGALGDILDPPDAAVPDVAHQLATECVRRGLPHGVINAAVEESTLRERQLGLALLPQVSSGQVRRRAAAVGERLRCSLRRRVAPERNPRTLCVRQDAFLRDHLRPGDVLVVSVGGNDVALKPTLETAAALGSLILLSSRDDVRAGMALGSAHVRERRCGVRAGIEWGRIEDSVLRRTCRY